MADFDSLARAAAVDYRWATRRIVHITHRRLGKNVVSSPPQDGSQALAASPESLALARELVRGCVARLGGDERLSYAAQLAVSEVLGSMFEQDHVELVELRWHVSPPRLEFFVSGQTGKPLEFGEIAHQFITTLADHSSASWDEGAMTVQLRFDL